MVQAPLRRLLALARTLVLGAAAGTSTSIQELLEQSTPGFGFLQAFFNTWLKLDLTTLAAALTIFGTVSSALRDLHGLGLKCYWWIIKFCTASISIACSDKLNREVLNWLGAQVLTRQGTRVLTARSENIENDSWRYRRVAVERNDYYHEKRVPIEYLPTFGATWFIHERRVFLVRRIPITSNLGTNNEPDEYSAAPEGDEPLVVMCLGRSVAPIKRFLDMCREFADKQRESFITIRASKNQYNRESWDTTILRPIRPLETVHFDEATKEQLVIDIRNYLDPATRQFYTSRGIPYRRGYLLHGPPGTGKTSLTLALAGYFGLELYLLHIPSVKEDSHLEALFNALPPRCIVLLEDIDAVGIKRQTSMDDEDDDDDDDDDESSYSRSRCTLSGLLNVLDGVASQEGRIVLMTSNVADKLDKALVRPGRIDMMIYLGNISQRSAELMFLRMYTPDRTLRRTNLLELEVGDEELQKLALQFSSQIPDNTFTPAQLQGYLLHHSNSPVVAAKETEGWVKEEKVRIEELNAKRKKIAERKANRRRERGLKLLEKLGGSDGGDDEKGRKSEREKEEGAEGKDSGEKDGKGTDIEGNDGIEGQAQKDGAAADREAEEGEAKEGEAKEGKAKEGEAKEGEVKEGEAKEKDIPKGEEKVES